VVAAIIAIKEGAGPDLMDDIVYGRKDATKEEVEKVQNNSTIKDYKGHLKSLGFDDSEIVALASIESYGNLWEPEH